MENLKNPEVDSVWRRKSGRKNLVIVTQVRPRLDKDGSQIDDWTEVWYVTSNNQDSYYYMDTWYQYFSPVI